MQIAKSKNVEDVGLMKEKFKEMGKELNDMKLMESIMREKLWEETTRVREKLQEKRDTTCYYGKSIYGIQKIVGSHPNPMPFISRSSGHSSKLIHWHNMVPFLSKTIGNSLNFSKGQVLRLEPEWLSFTCIIRSSRT